MTGDPFNMKKTEESFKKLDDDLNKIFKPVGNDIKKAQQYFNKKHNKKPQQTDIESIKKTAGEASRMASKLYKLATKNKIPKTYHEVMDMKDRLELEKTQRLEMIEAKKRIQELLKERKEESRANRKKTIQKARSIIGRIIKR